MVTSSLLQWGEVISMEVSISGTRMRRSLTYEFFNSFWVGGSQLKFLEGGGELGHLP